MAAQTVTVSLGQIVPVKNFFCKDANGNDLTGPSLAVTLDIVSGDPTGLRLDFVPLGNLVPTQITTLKAGTYTIRIKSANAGGMLETDAAGDSDGTADTIVVNSGAPATQGWTYA